MTTVDPVEIRPAERADLVAIYRIERRSFPQPWPLSAFEDFLEEPGFLVAVEDEAVIGYAVGDVVREPTGRIGHLKDLAVHPERRGRGIGRRLLRRVLGVLADSEVAAVKLEVRESNDTAIGLYRDVGFRATDRIEGYYVDAEDALVMTLNREPRGPG